MIQSVLHTDIAFLKGVGPQRAATLRNELGIYTYQNLAQLFPYKYIDRTRYYQIAELQQTQADTQIIGKIIHLKQVEQKRGSRLVATFSDGHREMELIWFQGIKWIKESIKLNVSYVIFGKVSFFNGHLSMAHPEMELLEQHEKNTHSFLQAIYPSTEKLQQKGISSKVISKWMYQLFSEIYGHLNETLPQYLLNDLKLIANKEALWHIHFPKNQELLAQAQFRLKFEELYFIQVQLISKKIMNKSKIKGYPFAEVGSYFLDFYQHHLPFALTNAQKKVLKEIRNDVAQPAQMNRLLQGDVGSGKTIVAFMSMLLAIGNGFQACLMAPTEILAQQHFIGISELAEKIGIKVALLTGSTKTAARRQLHEDLLSGQLSILIGTHALLEDKVQFHNLGLAIIDEQHRFGVAQRSKLWKKNTLPPHVLVMTATPIPRTLAMSLYGDLDISVIDELPPGRKPIKTIHKYDSNRLLVWKFVRDEIAKGRQVYIVYPLIQESEKMDYKDLMEGYEAISRDFPLPNYAISIVHGKMKPSEKDSEMKRFAEGKTQIMVATTVIEVGVNVPNASVMIIESAERFGLSQLHQLRGRVGRGAEQSFCVLMTGQKLSNDSKTRIETMCQTNDGFQISEVDLKLRGPGDLMGTQQSGVLNLRIADLVKDQNILQLARHHAILLFKKDPSLSLPEHQTVKKILEFLAQKNAIWNYIS